MPRFTLNSKCRAGARFGWAAVVAVGLVLPAWTSVHAQNRPPLPNEPVAMEGTMKQFYGGLNVLVVKTMDGVEHVYNFTKDLIVHGGKKPGVEALEGLREGTKVVIHYSTTTGPKGAVQEIDVLGDEGLSIIEGVVTDIDRGRKEITIKFADGQSDTFQMTSRAAAESEGLLDDSGKTPARIVIYYADELGRKVAHYLKKVS